MRLQAYWNGGPLPQDVRIQADPGTPAQDAPVALFGQGTFTFHVPGLFRTSPGHNLWVGGSPNLAKDGVAALGGIIETDWAPYTFTMNWRFTRAGHVVRFEENEPLAFLFPLPRDLLDAVVPRIAPIDEAPSSSAASSSGARRATPSRRRSPPRRRPRRARSGRSSISAAPMPMARPGRPITAAGCACRASRAPRRCRQTRR